MRLASRRRACGPPAAPPQSPNNEQVQVFGAPSAYAFGAAGADTKTPSGHSFGAFPSEFPVGPGTGLWFGVKTQDDQFFSGAMSLSDNEVKPTMLDTSGYLWNRTRKALQKIPIPTTTGVFDPPGPDGATGSTIDMMRPVTIGGVSYVFAVGAFNYAGWEIATYGDAYWLMAFKETAGVWAFDPTHSLTAAQLAASSSAGASAFPTTTNSFSETIHQSQGPVCMGLAPNSQHLLIGNYFDESGHFAGSIVAINPATGVVTSFFQVPDITDTNSVQVDFSVRDLVTNPTSGAGDERFIVTYDVFVRSGSANYGLHPLMEFSYNGSTTITQKSPPMSPFTMPDVGYVNDYDIVSYDGAGNLWCPTSGGPGLHVFDGHEMHLFMASGGNIATFEDGGASTVFPTFTKADFRFGGFGAPTGFPCSMNWDPVGATMDLLNVSGLLVGAKLAGSPALGPELCINGGLTSGTTGFNGFFGTSTLDTDADSDFASGECLVLTSVAGTQNVAAQSPISVTQLQNYILSCKVKGVTVAEQVQAELWWTDVNGAPLPTSVSPTVTMTSVGVVSIECLAAAPLGAAEQFLLIEVAAQSIGEEYKVGDVSLRSAPATMTTTLDTNKARVTGFMGGIFPNKGEIIDGRLFFTMLDLNQNYPADVGASVPQWLASVDLTALSTIVTPPVPPGPPAPSPTVPGAPMLLSVNELSGRCTPAWGASPDGGSPLTGYIVQRRTTGAFATIATLPPTVLAHADDSVTNGTTYEYQVIGENAVGNSLPSNPISATPVASPTAPGAPTALLATPGVGQVGFSWVPGPTGGSPITSYQLWRSEATGAETLHTSGISGSATSWTDSTGITAGTKEFYKLKAVNAVGAGTLSAEVSATPTAAGTGVVVQQLTVSGGVPGVRGQPGSAFHPGTGLMYYFGGNKGPALMDTWSFDPKTGIRKQLTTATMPANVATCLGYDPITGKLIAFGGDNESTFFNTTYSMDPTVTSPTWTLLNPAFKPGIRSGASMFNDPVTGDLMMYGGNTGTPTYYDDLNRWTGSNWVLVTSSLTGTGRTGAFIETLTNGKTVIFAGGNSDVLRDTHVWDGTTCVAMTPAHVPPARFFGGSAATDTGLMLIYGGANRLSTVNETDCWLWNGTDDWIVQSPTGVNMMGLSSQAMNWHPPTGQIISAFGTQGPTGSESGDINTFYGITVGAPAPPPPPTTLIQGLYVGANNVAGAVSAAAQLQMTLTGYSDFTDGTSWASIGAYTPPTLPAGMALLLSPDLTPNGTGLSAIINPGAAQTQAKNAFTELAMSLLPLTNAGHIVNLRLGCEMDGSWKPWGTGANGNTAAQFNPAVTLVIGWMKAANPALQFDFCCNTGTSTLAQLQVYYGANGSTLWNTVGGDHYDTSSGASDTFSACGAAVNLASLNNKPFGMGEWGPNSHDDSAFIDDAAQFIFTPSAASARYGWPPYTVGYHSEFDIDDAPIDSRIANKPNSLLAFQKDFP